MGMVFAGGGHRPHRASTCKTLQLQCNWFEIFVVINLAVKVDLFNCFPESNRNTVELSHLPIYTVLTAESADFFNMLAETDRHKYTWYNKALFAAKCRCKLNASLYQLNLLLSVDQGDTVMLKTAWTLRLPAYNTSSVKKITWSSSICKLCQIITSYWV